MGLRLQQTNALDQTFIDVSMAVRRVRIVAKGKSSRPSCSHGLVIAYACTKGVAVMCAGKDDIGVGSRAERGMSVARLCRLDVHIARHDSGPPKRRTGYVVGLK